VTVIESLVAVTRQDHGSVCPTRHRLNYNDCLEDKRKDGQNCSVPCGL